VFEFLKVEFSNESKKKTQSLFQALALVIKF